MSRFIIYALTDPHSGAVRYIGKSSHGLERPQSHARLAQRTDGRFQLRHCYNWIRQLLAVGQMYGIVVLEQASTKDDVGAREMWWIAFARAWGCKLTNLTDGGEGTSGYMWSTEQRLQLALVVRKALARPDVRARRSLLTRQIMARPEVKAKQRRGLIAAYSDPVVKARMSDAVREALADPIVKERCRATACRVHAAPEVRERHRAATIKTLDDPVVKARQREGLRRAWSDPTKRSRIVEGIERAARRRRLVREVLQNQQGPM